MSSLPIALFKYIAVQYTNLSVVFRSYDPIPYLSLSLGAYHTQRTRKCCPIGCSFENGIMNVICNLRIEEGANYYPQVWAGESVSNCNNGSNLSDIYMYSDAELHLFVRDGL
jgi:hypothetical protein